MPGYEDTHWAETERSVADLSRSSVRYLQKIGLPKEWSKLQFSLCGSTRISKSYIPSFTALQMIDDAPQSNWSTTRLRSGSV